jgi:triosephosphate isomerase (TIM)
VEPIVIVNFKAYEQGTGPKAVELASVCSAKGAWPAVQAADIAACSLTGAKVLAQHVDGVGFGAHTGSVLAATVKAAGAFGTLLNHSEKRLDRDEVFSAVKQCKDAGLKVVLCAASVEEAKSLSKAQPDYWAIELPELIGGDVSVVSADPDLVRRAVAELGDNVLVGAGVNSGEDLKASLDGGAKGVLVASAIVAKTADPEEALDKLYSMIR